MELDDIKQRWEALSNELENQKLLTDQIIIQMTKERYQKRLRGIAIPESIGSIICLGMAVYLAVHFLEMDTWYLQASVIFCILFCVLMPLASLNSIRNMQKLDLTGNSYRDTIIEFAEARSRFLLVQRIGIGAAVAFAIFFPMAFFKISTDINILHDPSVAKWYIPISLIFIVFFARWGYNCYVEMTKGAGDEIAGLKLP